MQSSLLVLIWLSSWCGLGACRACHDKAKFTENGFHMRPLLRFRYWRFCRFIRAEDFSLPFLCKISIACLPISKVAFFSSFQQNWFYFIRTSIAKVSAFSVFKKEFLTFPIWSYNIFLDYDVSMHNPVVPIVMIPTSPRLSETELVVKVTAFPICKWELLPFPFIFI